MPTDLTQGRYTREAIEGMIVRPEDLAADVGPRIPAKTTFLLLPKRPNDVQMARRHYRSARRRWR